MGGCADLLEELEGRHFSDRRVVWAWVSAANAKTNTWALSLRGLIQTYDIWTLWTEVEGPRGCKEDTGLACVLGGEASWR